MNTAIHPFDDALALGADAHAGVFTARTTKPYWNMVGPYGGITAAVLLNAVLRHPALLGEPLSLTVNYAAAIAEGAFRIEAVPVRTNRSTQHWQLSVFQAGADGREQLTTTASAVTAVRRQTWGVDDVAMPQVPAPADCARVGVAFRVQWLERYEMRAIEGGLPARWDDSGEASRSRLWVRDAPERPLDFCALASMADVFFPRVWLRRARQVPAGTVSMTVYFHAASADLAAIGGGYLLAQAQAQALRNGFFDQSAQLWSQAGALLASSHQIVYYKE